MFKSIIGAVCAYLVVVSFSANAALVNVALTGTASQSSTYPTSGEITNFASNAIDGNRDGLLAHTLLEANPWWRVDLDANYSIDYIVIVNRTDASKDRLTNFTVSILGDDDSILWTHENYPFTPDPIAVFDLTPFSSIVGSAVIIQLNDTNYLNLAEVEVLATSAVPIPAAVWLFGSGLIGLIGFARRKAPS